MIENEAVKEIKRLVKVFERHQERERQANAQLASFVMDYMGKNNFGKTSDEISELIYYLPNCHFRLVMYDNMFELRKAEEAASKVSGQIEIVCSPVNGEQPSVLEQLCAGTPPRESYTPSGRKAPDTSQG